MDEKSVTVGGNQHSSSEDDVRSYGNDEWGDTHNDHRDMMRLGKKQEFKVNTVRYLCVHARD